jgi:hypothetical protein
VEGWSLKPQKELCAFVCTRRRTISVRHKGRSFADPFLFLLCNLTFDSFGTLDRRGKVKYDIWKDLGGEFCRFCLFKENRETMEAINHLTSTLR